MNFYNKKLYGIGSILLTIVGIKIMYKKVISQGNTSMGGGEIYIGNSGYIVGGLFMAIGVFALYSLYRKK